MEYFYFCDGASRNNGRKDPTKQVLGSYGGVLTYNNKKIIKIFARIYENVTNNQMELLGFINPMTNIIGTIKNSFDLNNEKITIHIVSDSQYLIKGITEWMSGWKKKGWKNSSGKIIENIELWKIIDEIINCPFIEFSFKWVKGHSNQPEKFSDQYFNNICDKIANESIELYLSKKTNLRVFNEDINTVKNILNEFNK